MIKFEFVVTYSRSGGYENNYRLVHTAGATLAEFLKWYNERYKKGFSLTVTRFNGDESHYDIEPKSSFDIDLDILTAPISIGTAHGIGPSTVSIILSNNAEDSVSKVANKIRQMCSEAEEYERIIAHLPNCNEIKFNHDRNTVISVWDDNEVHSELVLAVSMFYENKLKGLREELEKITI